MEASGSQGGWRLLARAVLGALRLDLLKEGSGPVRGTVPVGGGVTALRGTVPIGGGVTHRARRRRLKALLSLVTVTVEEGQVTGSLRRGVVGAEQVLPRWSSLCDTQGWGRGGGAQGLRDAMRL